ncbi:type II toxin-antitoxin system CcdA family antitoxin [Paraburkholderia youngii]|uniref:type II toxin-antitoxin system CcdA family antitoxin n=2 Tax=Paraburkholderia TaxID=1822464 RepID=UPI003D1FB8BC
MSCASITTQSAKAPLVQGVLPEVQERGLDISHVAEAAVGRVAAEKRAAEWLKENAEAIESSNAYVEQHGLPLEMYRKFCGSLPLSFRMHGVEWPPGIAPIATHVSGLSM